MICPSIFSGIFVWSYLSLILISSINWNHSLHLRLFPLIVTSIAHVSSFLICTVQASANIAFVSPVLVKTFSFSVHTSHLTSDAFLQIHISSTSIVLPSGFLSYPSFSSVHCHTPNVALWSRIFFLDVSYTDHKTTIFLLKIRNQEQKITLSTSETYKIQWQRTSTPPRKLYHVLQWPRVRLPRRDHCLQANWALHWERSR